MIFLVGDNSQESSILPLLTIMFCILWSILEVFNNQGIVLMLGILLLNFHEISRIPTALLSLRDSPWEKQLCLKANLSLPKDAASFKVNPLPWPGLLAETQGWCFSLQHSTRVWFPSLNPESLLYFWTATKENQNMKLQRHFSYLSYSAQCPWHVLLVCCRKQRDFIKYVLFLCAFLITQLRRSLACHNHNCYWYVGVIWVNSRPLCCFSRDSESCSLQSNPALHNGFQSCFIWLLTHLCWGNGW